MLNPNKRRSRPLEPGEQRSVDVNEVLPIDFMNDADAEDYRLRWPDSALTRYMTFVEARTRRRHQKLFSGAVASSSQPAASQSSPPTRSLSNRQPLAAAGRKAGGAGHRGGGGNSSKHQHPEGGPPPVLIETPAVAIETSSSSESPRSQPVRQNNSDDSSQPPPRYTIYLRHRYMSDAASPLVITPTTTKSGTPTPPVQGRYIFTASDDCLDAISRRAMELSTAAAGTAADTPPILLSSDWQDNPDWVGPIEDHIVEWERRLFHERSSAVRALRSIESMVEPPMSAMTPQRREGGSDDPSAAAEAMISLLVRAAYDVWIAWRRSTVSEERPWGRAMCQEFHECAPSDEYFIVTSVEEDESDRNRLVAAVSSSSSPEKRGSGDGGEADQITTASLARRRRSVAAMPATTAAGLRPDFCLPVREPCEADDPLWYFGISDLCGPEGVWSSPGAIPGLAPVLREQAFTQAPGAAPGGSPASEEGNSGCGIVTSVKHRPVDWGLPRRRISADVWALAAEAVRQAGILPE